MIKNTHDFKPLEGKYVNLREVEIDDAAFILKLRCDEKKSRFLHKTENNLEKQIEYLKRYKTLDNEWYFIIENKKQEPIGTYRIYDLKDDSFCIGSWLMIDNCSPIDMMEGEYLAKMFAFKATGFNKFHFDVRKGNIQVQRFHEMFGAIRTGTTELDILYKYNKSIYQQNKQKFRKML